ALDRDRPGIHGDTICRMVVASREPAMVLMLTASAAPGERVNGLGIGADDYLPKPFHFPELVLRVRALAHRWPTASARVLRPADLELDPLRRLVTRAGPPGARPPAPRPAGPRGRAPPRRSGARSAATSGHPRGGAARAVRKRVRRARGPDARIAGAAQR